MEKNTKGNNQQLWRFFYGGYHGNKQDSVHGHHIKKYTCWYCQLDL